MSGQEISEEYWQNRAACRDKDPELFFPIGKTAAVRLQIEAAKAVCKSCPVVDDCLKEAQMGRIDFGIWGGYTEEERRAMGRRAGRAARIY